MRNIHLIKSNHILSLWIKNFRFGLWVVGFWNSYKENMEKGLVSDWTFPNVNSTPLLPIPRNRQPGTVGWSTGLTRGSYWVLVSRVCHYFLPTVCVAHETLVSLHIEVTYRLTQCINKPSFRGSPWFCSLVWSTVLCILESLFGVLGLLLFCCRAPTIVLTAACLNLEFKQYIL